MVQQTWMMMAAAQGNPKAVKEFLKPWSDILKKTQQGRNDLATFLSQYRAGI